MKTKIILISLVAFMLSTNLSLLAGNGVNIGIEPSNKLKKRSIIILIDVSSSMRGEKMENAKLAAINAIKNHNGYDTEFSILAFGGSCEEPITYEIDFTKNRTQLLNFIKQLEARGSTPMSSAYKFACNFMNKNMCQDSKEQTIILIGDGANNCGNLDHVLTTLKHKGILYMTKTIGLEVNRETAKQLTKIAEAARGSYRQVDDASELPAIMEQKSVETLTRNIEIRMKAVGENIYNDYLSNEIETNLENSIWVIDSINYFVHKETYTKLKKFKFRFTLRNFPHSFIFKNNKLTYYILDKKEWQNGVYTINDNKLTVDAKIQSDKLTNYPFRVKNITKNTMELSLKEYKGEKYCSKPYINTKDGSIIVYLSKINH